MPFWFTENLNWDEQFMIRTQGIQFPEPPLAYAQDGADRDKELITQLFDVPLRHVHVRPQRIIPSLAPMSGYQPTIPPPPMSWQKPIAELIPEGFTSMLNTAYLADQARRILANAGDPIAGIYMKLVYNQGGIDHCKLPTQFERYTVPNKVIQRGDKISQAWDEVIDKARARGRVIESTVPIVPGTVVSPINVNQKFKLKSKKWKYRVTCDGRFPRTEHRNIGGWSDPKDRLFSSHQIYHTCAMLIKQNCSLMSVFDYEEFFRYFPRNLYELGRNCIRWQHNNDTEWKYFYFLDDIFGHVTCPARLNLHAVVLQKLQEERMHEYTNGQTHLISRRVDDSLVLHPNTASRTDCEKANKGFESVCADAGQPLQQTKVERLCTKTEFDGYEIDLTRFTNNPFNAYGAGIGIADHRREHILTRLYRALQVPGLTRAKTDSLIALIQWAFRVLPMLRPCIREWRACMYACKADKDIVKLNAWATSDIQRIVAVFETGQVSTPVYHLFSITQPEGVITTDASGYDHIGGYYIDTKNANLNFYFTQPLTHKQRINPHPFDVNNNKLDHRVQLLSTNTKEYSLSTAFLELVGLYYGLVSAKSRIYNKVIKWVTDAKASKCIWDNMKSKSPAISRLLVLLGAYCSQHRILVDAEWVQREQNQGADALTHDDVPLFLQLHPQFAEAKRVQVPVLHCRKISALQSISMETN